MNSGSLHGQTYLECCVQFCVTHFLKGIRSWTRMIRGLKITPPLYFISLDSDPCSSWQSYFGRQHDSSNILAIFLQFVLAADFISMQSLSSYQSLIKTFSRRGLRTEPCLDHSFGSLIKAVHYSPALVSPSCEKDTWALFKCFTTIELIYVLCYFFDLSFW